jgi:hypothetical protein
MSRRVLKFVPVVVLMGLGLWAFLGTGPRSGPVDVPTAHADEMLTGKDLADQMNLTLEEGRPSGCQDYVEVDDPAGYCLDGAVSSVEESFVVGKLLRGYVPTDSEIQMFDLQQALNTAETPEQREAIYQQMANLMYPAPGG